MSKYRYNINNLDCANCARKIEEMLNNNSDFKNASVNFNTCKVSYESDKEYSLKDLNELVKGIEPDAYLTEEEVEKDTKQFHLSILIIALVIGILAYLLPLSKSFKLVLYIVSYGLLLYRTTINSIKLLIKGNGINENALIKISCLGALLIGEVM